jgi:hypothetical protein
MESGFSIFELFKEIILKKSAKITSIGGSVVECSPATRAARVRFPADADFFS